MRLRTTSNLNIYLEQIQENDMDNLLSRFLKVVVYKKPEDISQGLLRFNNIPDDTAYHFIFDSEKVLTFHTVGMKFPINIEFFDSDGEYIKTYKNCKPGIEKISSIKPAKFAVEYSTERENI